MAYSTTFKRRMMERMLEPDAVSILSLSRQSGVSRATLARWREEAIAGQTSGAEEGTRDPLPRRPQDWSPKERLEAITKASGLGPEALGAFLRKEGLREADLAGWRQSILEAMDGSTEKDRRKEAALDRKRIKELERELRRKDKALAEAATLLILKKKAEALWGGGDDDTD